MTSDSDLPYNGITLDIGHTLGSVGALVESGLEELELGWHHDR